MLKSCYSNPKPLQLFKIFPHTTRLGLPGYSHFRSTPSIANTIIANTSYYHSCLFFEDHWQWKIVSKVQKSFNWYTDISKFFEWVDRLPAIKAAVHMYRTSPYICCPCRLRELGSYWTCRKLNTVLSVAICAEVLAEMRPPCAIVGIRTVKSRVFVILFQNKIR